ncbi:MAG TPA: ABC transporter permease [Candidatus Aquilonibacter sp.]
MLTYVVRRVFQSIPLLLLISMILFGIISEAPGGPLTPYLQNPHITEADIVRLKHNLGLDQPVPIQYLHWLGQVVRGDFGYSTSNSETAMAAVQERIPWSLELMGTAIGLALVVGVVFGIISAIKQYSWIDFLITTLAFFGQSMPVFWFALMMQLAFSVYGFTGFGYHIALPSAGSSASDTFDLGDRIEHLILPAVVLSLLYLAIFSRFMRSSMLEVIHSDYIRTASAKGLTRFNVVMRHGFRNALIPLVTIVALTIPDLVGGAIVTETIFAWPGMGRLFFTALTQFDFAVLMALMCLSALFVVLANLAADVGYAWLDPRVKYS